MDEQKLQNPMREPRLAKVVVNIGVGEGGEKLVKAEKVLTEVTGGQPSRTLSRVVNREWGLRKGGPIGVRVTLRGEQAEAFLKKALWVRNNRVPAYSFDDYGNLNFGIADHTDFEGMKYEPDIGIFGMDIAVVVERPGTRIKRRRILKRKVPDKHRMTRQEAAKYMIDKFGLEVV